MSAVLQRIEQTREALEQSLAKGDWLAITELDLSTRICLDDVLADAADPATEQQIRSSLEDLLTVYRHLIEAATAARQSIVDEMLQIRQAKNAAKVYHLFG